MILLYIDFKRFFVNFKGFSDGKLVSLTKKEHDSVVNYLQMFIKSLKSISDELFNAIC